MARHFENFCLVVSEFRSETIVNLILKVVLLSILEGLAVPYLHLYKICLSCVKSPAQRIAINSLNLPFSSLLIWCHAQFPLDSCMGNVCYVELTVLAQVS